MLARAVLDCEWLILLVMAAIVWISDFNRVWVLAFWAPVLAARWIVERRLWPRTPLDPWFAALFVVGIVNLLAAPYRYAPIRLGGSLFALPTAYSLIALGRPLFGLVLVTTFASLARRRGQFDRLLLASTGLALLVGSAGLLAAQYTVKSLPLQPVLELLPRWRGFPGAEGGFNVNEIAGAMAWLAPLMAGVSLHLWRDRSAERGRTAAILRVLAPAAFALLWAALFFGQSRFAIAGVLPALAALVWLLLRGRWRWIGLGLVAVFVVLQLALVIQPDAPATGDDRPTLLNERDQATTSQRLEIWGSALGILRDYPLTGVGINMFRHEAVRAQYPAPSFSLPILPHAHNEWLQIAADLGLPGLAVFAGIQITAGWMLWRVWRTAPRRQQALAAAVAAGLLAHGVYGLGDAIALWDRFAFVYWWLIALAAALFVLRREAANPDAEQDTNGSPLNPSP